MKKLLKIYIALALCLLYSGTASAISFHFNGNNYNEAQYSLFISALRTNFANNRVGSFSIVIGVNGESLPITINNRDLYITHINGVEVRNPRYIGGDANINYEAISTAFFDGLRNRNQGRTLKILAFIISEAVRFQIIESNINISRVLFSDSGGALLWSDYANLIHSWSEVSRILISVDLPPSGIRNNASGLLVGITLCIYAQYRRSVIKR